VTRTGGSAEVGLYLPQVALSYDEVLSRALDCERLGFSSLWLFDHLFTPDLPEQPAFEGWTLATALLARTTTLRVGHMVLCANFRHPALLGRMVSTLAVVSGGRFSLGLGSGSYADEHARAGLPWGTAAERAGRLRETLEILTRMATPGPTTWHGEYFAVQDLPNLPLPASPPPIHLGGIGPRLTLPLVARFADVWNVPTYGVGRRRKAADALAAECEQIGRDPGTIRRSMQLVVGVAEDAAGVATTRRTAERRFGGPGFDLAASGVIGRPEEVVERMLSLVDEGWTEFALFLPDRGERPTLELLAAEVLPYL
jgi:alkanesulfonate monooxygenase SsuD/methylene tetrahydromethanopterin reductase-like flavin-dependent oxidoreductase (luciferase family)